MTQPVAQTTIPPLIGGTLVFGGIGIVWEVVGTEADTVKLWNRNFNSFWTIRRSQLSFCQKNWREGSKHWHVTD